MTVPIRRTLVRLPADPARTDVKLGQRAFYDGEWVERPYLPVSHPAPTAAEAADREAAAGVVPARTSAAVDLAALRSLLWYRGDLAGELVTT